MSTHINCTLPDSWIYSGQNFKKTSITPENFGPMFCSVVETHHQIKVQTISAGTEVFEEHGFRGLSSAFL